MASTAARWPLDVTTWICFGSFTILPESRSRTRNLLVDTCLDAARKAVVALARHFWRSSDNPSSSFQISFPSNVASSLTHSLLALFSAFSTSFSSGLSKSSCSSICSVKVWSSRWREFIFDGCGGPARTHAMLEVLWGAAAASAVLSIAWPKFQSRSHVLTRAGGCWPNLGSAPRRRKPDNAMH